MSSVVATNNLVLMDAIWPRTRTRATVQILGLTAFTALCAQVAIPLPFSPVPLTLQTFAVLIGAAAIGPVRGMLAMSLYFVLGAAGLPIYSGASGGMEVAFGATSGYLIGFIAAAGLVGYLTRFGNGRRFTATALSFLVGSAVIYTLGVVGLMVSTGMSFSAAVAVGVVPFLIGDAIKAAAAGGLLPVAWKLTGSKGE